MKVQKFNEYKSYTKSKFVSDAQVDDILDTTKGKDMTEYQKKRIDMFNNGDEEVGKIVDEFAEPLRFLSTLSDKLRKFVNSNGELIVDKNDPKLKELMNKLYKSQEELENVKQKLRDLGIEPSYTWKKFATNRHPDLGDIFSEKDGDNE